MVAQARLKLSTVPYAQLASWSVQQLSASVFSYNAAYPLVPVSDFLSRNKSSIDIHENEQYKRVTIRMNNGGVLQRDTERGRNIGTKKQFIIREGQFLLSKIDARNGAFGVVPAEADGAIITGNFWAFDVDTARVNPRFLALLATTPEFVRFCESASNGTTNRHYLQEALFLQTTVPLPDINEQQHIVARYEAHVAAATAAETEAGKLEAGIEQYMGEVLGIPAVEAIQPRAGLQTVSFKHLTRWDVFSTGIPAEAALREGTYELQPIGMVCDFPRRPWVKRLHSAPTLSYIEMGSIHTALGTVSPKELPVNKAPSRATQTVQAGDLIIGTTRPYLKRFAIIGDGLHGSVVSSAFAIIAPTSRCSLPFLKEFLCSRYGVEQLKNNMTGTTYPAITTDKLKEIVIPIPPLGMQKHIAGHIAGLRARAMQLRQQAAASRQTALTEFKQTIFVR